MIRHLFISGGHDFFGRYGEAPGVAPIREVASVECVANRGLVGDRFFDHKPDYKGQITLFDQAVYQSLWNAFPTALRDPGATRRNVVTEGLELNALIGQSFELGGVAFAGVEECSPCTWMDRVIADGALEFLRGRGGLRARILTDGTLTAQPEHRVAGAVLCGGNSRRMGADKATLEWEGVPLWRRALSMLDAAGVTTVYLGAPAQPAWAERGMRVIPDLAAGKGPVAALAACLEAARDDGFSHLAVLAVDLPVLSAPLIRSLRASTGTGKGVIPRGARGFEPLAAIYPVEAIETILALISEKNWKLQTHAQSLLDAGLVTAWDVPDEHSGQFRNLNSPSD